jgi:hypothetical protein
MFRQGDVLLVECPVPKKAKRMNVDGRLVLALGEVTGHAHVIEDVDSFEAYEDQKGTMFIRLKHEAALSHEEHGQIQLPAREYKRVLQREFVPKLNKGVTVRD